MKTNQKILGMDPAYKHAKQCSYGANMSISAALVVEMVERIAELEKDRDRYKVFVIAHLPQVKTLAKHSKHSAIIEVKANAILEAHNLEQQAKALFKYAASVVQRERLLHISLSERTTIHDSCRNQADDYLNQAKALKESEL